MMDMDSGTAPDIVQPLRPGMHFGRYQLVKRLALGGMAELHLARVDGVAGFQKLVALKRVLPHLAEDHEFVELFLNEARIAAKLDHPGIAQVMDIGEDDGEYFYVMEYVHGQNARVVLQKAATAGGRIPLASALTVAMQTAQALHYVHERCDIDGRPLGLVHRDVSPSNVLISYDGAVKIADFGIVKASARNEKTLGAVLKGKVGYMSPEQCRGDRVDRRTDIFSLGILLYELTTTERLFVADNDFAIFNMVLAGRFDLPSRRVHNYPPELERIVLNALQLNPDDRYATAQQLHLDLERFSHAHRLRCTSAGLSEYMRTLFGDQPYPRVPSTPPGSIPRPASSTSNASLVPLPMSVSDEDQPTRLFAGGEAVDDVLMDGVVGRTRRAWAWVGGLTAVGLATALWMGSGDEPPSTVATPKAAPPADAPDKPVHPAARSEPAIASPGAEGATASDDAMVGDAHAGDVSTSDAAADSGSARKKSNARRRRKSRPKRSNKAKDLNSLYPL